MKKIILSSIFLILSSVIFAGNDFACSKMNNKRGLGYGAVYGSFYALGYNDARKKKTDKKFNKVMKKIMKYIKAGCKKDPKSNIVTLFRKGIKSGYATSDFSKRALISSGLAEVAISTSLPELMFSSELSSIISLTVPPTIYAEKP